MRLSLVEFEEKLRLLAELLEGWLEAQTLWMQLNMLILRSSSMQARIHAQSYRGAIRYPDLEHKL